MINKDIMKQLLIIISIVYCTGCQSAGTNNGTDSTAIHPLTDTIQPEEKLHDMNVAAIKKHMELQKHLEDESNRTSYTEADVNIAIPLLAEALKENRFVPPTDAVFQQKVRAIFGEEALQPNYCGAKQHAQFVTLLAKENSDEYDYTEDHIMLSKEQHFLFSVPFLGDFINFKDSTHYTFRLPPVMAARNRYLLNDNKADLAYLLAEDTLFIKSLVLRFGYTTDQRLNDVAMNDIARWSDDDIIKVCEYIFVKDCKGNLQIREGLLQWITAHSDANENRMAFAIYYYATSMYGGDASAALRHDPKTYFDKEQKRKIAAYVINTWVPLHEKYAAANPAKWSVADLIENLTGYDPGLQEYIVKNNYFSLPALQKEISARQ